MISCPDLVALLMGKLALDNIWIKAKFVEQG